MIEPDRLAYYLKVKLASRCCDQSLPPSRAVGREAALATDHAEQLADADNEKSHTEDRETRKSDNGYAFLITVTGSIAEA
jgi:hypothetical protein